MTTLVLQMYPSKGTHEMFTFICDSICTVINLNREQFDVLHVEFVLSNGLNAYLYVVVEPQKDTGVIIESICKPIEMLDSVVIDPEIHIIDGFLGSNNQ